MPAAGARGARHLPRARASPGLPVFAGGGSGLAWLLGPTGGYLLAFPVAAAVAGALAARGGFAPRPARPAPLGMVVIHAGGVAQLALLSGDLAAAFRLGFVPFLTGDLLKVGLAAALVIGARRRSWPRCH